ncbi:MAG TPA: hypothetical protein VMQ81_12030 [Acidimicrobiia bacterium]|nr:hypothetical protein [Acidimicrobiia bacterium]
MRSRSTRTLVAILATLGLVGAMTAIPVAAVTDTPECDITADGSATEDVTDGVALTFDSDFACTDADTTGTWSIIVNVANDSETDVTVDAISLSHVTPPFAEDGANTADDGDTLPTDVPAGAVGTFEVGGDYALADTDDGGLVNLHLRATGSTADDESAPFVLGINVHVLGPGVELDDDEDGAADGEGRPAWVPGPPPWVAELLWTIFNGSFPWGTDSFPPNADADEENGDATLDGDEADGAPPAFLQLPPPASGAADDDGGVPSWVAPGGPPAWAPGGGADDEDEDEDEAGGPRAGAGRP